MSIALPAANGQEVFAVNPKVRDDIDHLQTWLIKQRHLPRVTDRQLEVFLHSNNNSLAETKSCIDAFYTCRFGSPEFFKGRDPFAPDVQQAAKVIQITSLTSTSPEGYVYFITRLIDTDPAVYYPEAVIKLGFMVLDATLRQRPLVPGIIVIQDMTGVVFSHMAKVDFSTLKKQIYYVERGMPVQLKEIHPIYVGPVIHSIMSIIKPFMSKEHHKLIHFHSGEEGMRDLHNFVPKRLLPKDYGGDDVSMDELCSRSMEQLVSYRDWFKEEEEHCKVDESKREGKMASGGDIFGEQGSFKKLTLD